MTLQEIIKKLRETRTQHEIATESGFLQATICRLENGQTKTMSYDREIRFRKYARKKGIKGA